MSPDDVPPRRSPRRTPDAPPAPNVPLLDGYTRVVILRSDVDPSERFLARVPALPGCYAIGQDREEVLEALAARALERLEHLLLAGQPLPEADLPPGFEGMVIDRTE